MPEPARVARRRAHRHALCCLRSAFAQANTKRRAKRDALERVRQRDSSCRGPRLRSVAGLRPHARLHLGEPPVQGLHRHGRDLVAMVPRPAPRAECAAGSECARAGDGDAARRPARVVCRENARARAALPHAPVRAA